MLDTPPPLSHRRTPRRAVDAAAASARYAPCDTLLPTMPLARGARCRALRHYLRLPPLMPPRHAVDAAAACDAAATPCRHDTDAIAAASCHATPRFCAAAAMPLPPPLFRRFSPDCASMPDFRCPLMLPLARYARRAWRHDAALRWRAMPPMLLRCQLCQRLRDAAILRHALLMPYAMRRAATPCRQPDEAAMLPYATLLLAPRRYFCSPFPPLRLAAMP